MTDTTHELTMSRWFAAPPEVVYRAFSDPEQLAQWMGPLMFTVPLDTVDVDAAQRGALADDDGRQGRPDAAVPDRHVADRGGRERAHRRLRDRRRLARPRGRHPDGAVARVHPRRRRHPARAASGPGARRDERDGRDRLDAGVPQARRPARHAREVPQPPRHPRRRHDHEHHHHPVPVVRRQRRRRDQALRRGLRGHRDPRREPDARRLALPRHDPAPGPGPGADERRSRRTG